MKICVAYTIYNSVVFNCSKYMSQVCSQPKTKDDNECFVATVDCHFENRCHTDPRHATILLRCVS